MVNQHFGMQKCIIHQHFGILYHFIAHISTKKERNDPLFSL